MNTLIVFLICFIGIFLVYLAFSLVQETIYKTEFSNGEKFDSTTFLVYSQALSSLVFGYIICKVGRIYDRNNSPLYLYVSCSLTYFLAMICSNYSLFWVNYPTQVIGKSCKPVSVMLFSAILAKRSYALNRYLAVLCIVTGVIMFNLLRTKEELSFETGPGNMFIIASLFFDGLTASSQEILRAKYNISSYFIMFEVNKWAVIILTPVLILSGEAIQTYYFIIRNPNVLPLIAGFSLLSALGQNFVFLTVNHFGTLTLSLMTTTRKFFSVLGSILIYGHTLSQMQQLSVVVVFAGLLLDNLSSKISKALHTTEDKNGHTSQHGNESIASTTPGTKKRRYYTS